MTTQLFKTTLPSGRLAAYSTGSYALAASDARDPGEHLICYGTQVAHEFNGNWYWPGSWTMITDDATLTQLDRAKMIQQHAKVPQ